MAHISRASYLICPFCSEPVELETANTDQNGRAVHENCYVAYIASQGRILLSTSRGLSILRSLTLARYN